jgi:phage host-nuclease inhibitor protein Gam
VKNGYNGKKASITAGYSEKGADQEAARLLTNVKVKERIDYHKNNLEELCLISKAKLVNFQLGIVDDDTSHPITRQTAVKSLVDMLGYSSPVKTDITTNGNSINPVTVIETVHSVIENEIASN